MLNKQAYMRGVRLTVEQNKTLVVVGVGSGITAKGAVRGGADLLATYNTAVYRIQGMPTVLAFLPYDDCNALAFSVLPQVLAAAGDTPVMIGLGAHDPRRNLAAMVEQAKALGAAGVTNEPFAGMYEGDVRRQLEAAGIGFSREVELIRLASQAGLLTLGYVFTPQEAIQMADAGADFIGIMVGGVTSGGDTGGAETVGLDEAVQTVLSITKELDAAGKRCITFVHGGPLNDVKPVQTMLDATGVVGYITGSTGERVPTELAVSEKVRCFKSIQRRKPI